MNRAGTGLLTLIVEDLDDELAQLRARGIEAGEVETISAGVRKTIVIDPDGNSITIGEVPSPGR